MTYMLILVTCLSVQAGTPASDCAEERLALPGVTTAAGCHLAARLRLVEWLKHHDIRRLTDARCEAPVLSAAG